MTLTYCINCKTYLKFGYTEIRKETESLRGNILLEKNEITA